ncbi:hypothetical protein MES5069_520042 [Mesorhizobium escarrei]|uniref:Uncharacterized protein n=1 Tax=Mesorhizobium escarrei TaxID=666018 RepID=A0ABM9EAL5_9HYPH|nr:hypothetical protein MES5069_520042 [Mesorhizobium escarrei]
MSSGLVSNPRHLSYRLGGSAWFFQSSDQLHALRFDNRNVISDETKVAGASLQADPVIDRRKGRRDVPRFIIFHP